MVRLIKRYESRKLYDTEESRYVSLEDLAGWVRGGQEVKIIDNGTSEDVTGQTLTQIILDEGRKGTSLLPSELLHELVRAGERAVSTGMGQLQQGVDRIFQASIDRLGPLRRVREEMGLLRQRLEELEDSLETLESERASAAVAEEIAKPAKRRAAAPHAGSTKRRATGNRKSPTARKVADKKD